MVFLTSPLGAWLQEPTTLFLILVVMFVVFAWIGHRDERKP